MWQKFRTNNAAESDKIPEQDSEPSYANRNDAVADRPANGEFPVSGFQSETTADWVMPFLCTLGKGEAGEDRSNQGSKKISAPSRANATVHAMG